MQGALFEYARGLAAFESSAAGAVVGSVVFIAGLGDGLQAHGWLEELAQALGEVGLTLVQYVQRTSYQQYGLHTLQEDCEDLCALLEHLQTHRHAPGHCYYLLGHSTGCQDIMVYLRDGLRPEHRVVGAHCLAPVSDREYHAWAAPAATEASVGRARAMDAAGRPWELLPRGQNEAPLSAARALALLAPHGADDFFSLDLDAAHARAKFPCAAQERLAAHPHFRSLTATCALDDEYVPDDGAWPRGARVRALAAALPRWYPVFTEAPVMLHGGHDFAESAGELCARVVRGARAAMA